jgi:tetratricopeptide (TPR) repeat protein
MTESIDQRKERTIRVFVSSTFRDLQAERDELVKFAFPQLRMICERRGVTWVEVDLRWGVTDEQKAEGKVLPICLDEIQRCRPFFIGILGERYGWIPQQIEPKELEKLQPWLRDNVGKSITELEILHGVLNDPQMEHRAFFFFKDPSFLSRIARKDRFRVAEYPTPKELKELGHERAWKHAKERQHKLEQLRKRIDRRGFPHHSFKDSKDLGELVLEKFRGIIERDYPEPKVDDVLESERIQHRSFARNRSQVYIGRQEYMQRLAQHVRSKRKPLVVVGPSGSGKSALLAAFWAQREENNTIIHFAGSTPRSSDWPGILQYFMREFQSRFALKKPIPTEDDEIRIEFPKWCSAVSTKGKAVLILDALNQVSDCSPRVPLYWLPSTLPPNVRLIVSTIEGELAQVLRERRWEFLEMQSLSIQERKHLVIEYLSHFAKTIDSSLLNEIIEVPQTGNPLYLRTLLDELRLYGDNDTVKANARQYLQEPDTRTLFVKVLERFEKDYGGDERRIPQRSLPVVWGSRYGLDEKEICQLLGTSETPLPMAEWIPFRSASDSMWLSHSGRLTFHHDVMRQAVATRYCAAPAKQRKYHSTLADYFEKSEERRRLEEQPYHLAKARRWKDLNRVLGDPVVLSHFWRTSKYELKQHWGLLLKNKFKPEETYSNVLGKPGKVLEFLGDFIMFFFEVGKWDEAIRLSEYKIRHFRRKKDPLELAKAILEFSEVALDRDESKRAERLLKEAEAILSTLDKPNLLSDALVNRAYSMYGRDDLALELLTRATDMCEGLEDVDIGTCYNNRAYILRYRGDYAEAIKLYLEAERRYREEGDMEGVITGECNRATIECERGNYESALKMALNTSEMFEAWGDVNGVLWADLCRVMVLYQLGRLDEANSLIQKAIRIGSELDDMEWMPIVLGYQGLIRIADARSQEGIRTLKSAIKKTRDVYYTNYFNIHLLRTLADIEKWSEAEAIMREVKKDVQRHGYLPLVSLVAAEEAHILAHRGRFPQALKVAREGLRIASKLGFREGMTWTARREAEIILRKA